MRLNEKQEQFIKNLYIDLNAVLSAYAYKTLKDKHLAEEAVQEAFYIACVKVSSCMECPNPKGWLMVVLKNVISNMRKDNIRYYRTFIPISVYNLPQTIFIETDTDVHYYDFLSEPDLAIFKKIVLNGITLQEASCELGITQEACKKRLQRARRRLKEKLVDNSHSN